MGRVRELTLECTKILGIHQQDQIGFIDLLLRDSLRPMSTQVDAMGTNQLDKPGRGFEPIVMQKARTLYGQVLNAALCGHASQTVLGKGTPADVAKAQHQHSLHGPRQRQEPRFGRLLGIDEKVFVSRHLLAPAQPTQ
jgi:hypothetical protein